MNKDTKIIISIAERPGNLGVEFHNQGYVHLGLNFVYLPLKVLPTDLEGTISLIRNNFRGCSVSMPHKEKIAMYLDELDKTAIEVGAVNTTLNESGKLIGYNTDVLGARTAIESRLDVSGKKVLMLGAGGAARAVGYAVKQLGGRLAIANRTEPKARELADKLEADLVPWQNIGEIEGHLLINATNVGMDSTDKPIVGPGVISKFDAVMDVVIPSRRLIDKAKKQGKVTIPGRVMAVHQAAEQFNIYTGQKLPDGFLKNFY